jgi:hypothetical protein
MKQPADGAIDLAWPADKMPFLIISRLYLH